MCLRQAGTGAEFDAMVHAIEAYCVPIFHPMGDAIALQTLKFVGRSFLKELGLVHAISHMIGAEYHTHHGLTNAVLLPTVLKFNQSTIEHKVPDMCHALGFSSRHFDGFLGEINTLLGRLEIPSSLEALGVKSELIDSIAEKASKDPVALTNPRSASIGEIKDLIAAALKNARP